MVWRDWCSGMEGLMQCMEGLVQWYGGVNGPV